MRGTRRSGQDGDGRREALADGDPPAPEGVERTVEATRELGFFQWRQHLKFARVGHTTCFSEGNGEAVLK